MKWMAALITILTLATVYPAAAQDVYLKKNQTPLPELQDKDITTLSNEYYKNCLKKEDPILTPDSLHMMCACTSAKIAEVMTPEELYASADTTEQGQAVRDKMTMQVYVPCLEYPAHDLALYNCINDETIRASFKKYKEVCGCIAKNATQYWIEQGSYITDDAIKKGDNSIDPLINFFNSKSYELRAEYYVKTCVQRHEMGW